MPGTVGSELGLTHLVPVNCDWERQPVWSATGSQCGSPYTCLTLSPPAVQNRSHSKHQLSRTIFNFCTPTLLKIHPKSDKEKLFTFQNHLESNWKHFALCPFTGLSALHNRRVSRVCVFSPMCRLSQICNFSGKPYCRICATMAVKGLSWSTPFRQCYWHVNQNEVTTPHK